MYRNNCNILMLLGEHTEAIFIVYSDLKISHLLVKIFMPFDFDHLNDSAWITLFRLLMIKHHLKSLTDEFKDELILLSVNVNELPELIIENYHGIKVRVEICIIRQLQGNSQKIQSCNL